jgi:FG-GAP-like repeat
MSIRRHPLNPRGLAAALPVVCALLAAAGLMAPPAAGADDWVTFVDQTATRIVADPSVGVSDPEEKDLIVGDVDKDGDPDLIIVRKIPFTHPGGFRNVLFMNEGGVMTDRTATLAPDFLDATDDRDVELADVDGDTWLDIITAGTFGQQPRILMNLGSVGGVWQGFQYQPARLPFLMSPTGNGPKFCGLGVGDVTGNSRPDLYFADYENDMEDKLLINDGKGFFTDETASRLTAQMVESTFGTDADIADVNGDHFNDIIKDNATGSGTGTGFSPAIEIFYNDGTGHFTSLQIANNDAPYMVEPADFTQDGRLDLFIVDDGQDRYLVNTGNDVQGHAQFTAHLSAPSPNTNFFGGNVVFADLDHDGILDVLVSDVDTDESGCSRQFVALRGQGVPPNVTYSDPLNGASRPWTTLGTYDAVAFDIDHDGVLDLWLGTCSGNKVFMGVNPNLLFRDGFESGDTSRWSAAVP